MKAMRFLARGSLTAFMGRLLSVFPADAGDILGQGRSFCQWISAGLRL